MTLILLNFLLPWQEGFLLSVISIKWILPWHTTKCPLSPNVEGNSSHNAGCPTNRRGLEVKSSQTGSVCPWCSVQGFPLRGQQPQVSAHCVPSAALILNCLAAAARLFFRFSLGQRRRAWNGPTLDPLVSSDHTYHLHGWYIITMQKGQGCQRHG